MWGAKWRSRAFATASRAVALGAPCLGAGAGMFACDEPQAPAGSEPAVQVAGLSPEVASQRLAKVGDREIRLADYAAALQRMDRFERMRYQTEDRRQELLDELIDLELLAREAERRGLAEEPRTKELLWQALRNEALSELRAGLPEPASYPASEVSRYYEAHRSEFVDPVRVRVARIELDSAQRAEKVLGEALGSSMQRFGELAQRERALSAPDSPGAAPALGGAPSAEAPPEAENAAFEAADWGFVSRAEPARVPEAVRLAALQLERDGQVLPSVVSAAGKYYVVRRVSGLPERQRPLEEVAGAVRNRLAERRFETARQELIEALRGRVEVHIDEAALARVPPP